MKLRLPPNPTPTRSACPVSLSHVLATLGSADSRPQSPKDPSAIMAPKNVTDPRPGAHQERGPEGCPWHIDVRSNTLNFQDSTSSAFGPDEFDPDAAYSDEEDPVGQDAPSSDDGS